MKNIFSNNVTLSLLFSNAQSLFEAGARQQLFVNRPDAFLAMELAKMETTDSVESLTATEKAAPAPKV